MTYGSLSLFYGGLESLLGPPKMYKGPGHAEKSLFNTMEFEHTGEKDSHEKFTSGNGMSSTPETEWNIVVKPEKGVEYPERDGFREQHPGWCRVPVTRQTLQDMEEKCNVRLRKDGHSEMIKRRSSRRLIQGRCMSSITSCCVPRAGSTYGTDGEAAQQAMATLRRSTRLKLCDQVEQLAKAGKVRGIKDATLPRSSGCRMRWSARRHRVRLLLYRRP